MADRRLIATEDLFLGQARAYTAGQEVTADQETLERYGPKAPQGY